MTLEQQVCTIELAKKLKDLGVKQKSIYFHWATDIEQDGLTWWTISEKEPRKGKRVRQLSTPEHNRSPVSAFTVAELGEMLPISITRKDKQKFSPAFYKNRGDFSDEVRWSIEYSSYSLDNGEIEVQRVGDTEADARAKMLIYLVENHLVESTSLPSTPPQ